VTRLTPASWLAVGAVAALQTAVLGWMVYDRLSLLRYGREIVVEVVPVDPRDLFRGDYVIFGYPFSQTGDIPVPASTRQGDAIYVTLKPKGGDAWEIVKADAAYPDTTEPENVVLRGLTNYVSQRDAPAGPTASLRYGIESYFVPEGTGRKLEELVRDKKIAAVIAVGKTGEAAIKALVIDGKRVVEEPLL
jgi:uncharacterized membrane-anchored protein